MGRIRWLLHLGTPAVVVAAVAVGLAVVPFRLSAGASAASVRSCPSPSSFFASVTRAARRAPIAAQVDLRPKIGQAGDEVGQTLAIKVGSTLLRSDELTAESFAASPVGNVVVFGQREPSGTKVRAVDLETSCEYTLNSSSDAVRSAVISRGLDALYVHSVAAGDRTDRGVRRVDLASGTSRVVVPPLVAAEPFGLTYATLLRWSLAGEELAVQSCGMALCRTRVLDVVSGGIQTIDKLDHAELVGLTATHIYTFGVCPGRPCPLLSIDRSTGAASPLADSVYTAQLGNDAGAAVLSIETPAGAKEIRP